MTATRTERDLLGEKAVPADAYYGIQTARALENFRITGQAIHPALVKGLAQVKKAAALANCQLGYLHLETADGIAQAADEVIAGKLRDQFLVDPIQGGAGTSANMNANEVIANRAIEILGGQKGDYLIVSPNDHVNFAQSTNDVFPTAIRLAVLSRISDLGEALHRLEDALLAKAVEFDDVVKMGRTHLQDAVPIRLGQEFHAWATAVRRGRVRIEEGARGLEEINMGATAVGTGLNADPAYPDIVIGILAAMTGRNLRRPADLIDATQNIDGFVAVSGQVKSLAVALCKIANDIRLMASGPRTGLKEINLPEMQPGSSIMPGKVNPVMAEVLNQTCFYVMGADLTVTLAAEAGQLELNVMEPVLAHSLLSAIDALTNAVGLFTERLVRGVTANRERCEQTVASSVGIVTALNPVIGYKAASLVAREATLTGRPVREIVLEKGLLGADELDRLLSPHALTEMGIAKAHQK
ncbi:MAG TPA: aspartate ammonia-lyase [Symbiobacteriaceae bacterium]|nr:aspartate ammonia-lyase [Symbiobacteriaceae bacterium]